MIVDKLGHCVKCGKNLIVDRNIKGILKKWILPDYDQIKVELNDSSKMRIVICKPCKAILKDKDYPTLMKSVIAGWQKEVDHIKHWDIKKKKDHMKIYKKKKIKHKVKEFKYGDDN